MAYEKRVPRRIAQVLIGAVALAVLSSMVGCSEGGQTGPTQSPAVPPSHPSSGGTLSIAAAADAQPQFVMANRAGNWSWRRLVFESLVELDKQGQPQPLLATSWQYNADRTELTVDLRQGVTFHSGRAFTADDVVFSLTEAAKPENASQLAKVAQVITEVAPVTPNQVVIKLAAPSDSIFDLLDLTPIVDKDTWGSIADGKQVIGTGPFTWVNWTPGASISLQKNSSYWVPDRPVLDAVEVSIIKDSTALQTALKSHTADVALGMSQSDITLLKQDPTFQAINAGGVFYPLGVDITKAPFDNVQARQALGYAIDRERISQQVFGGDSTLSSLWWTPNSPGFPTDLQNFYSYDPEKAKALLTQAGAAGADVTITFANMPVMKSLFEIVQNNLTAVGLNVQAEVLDVTEYDQRQVQGKLGQSFLLLHGMVGFSAATIIDAMPAIRAGNPSHFDTPTYDELKKAVREANDTTRDEALKALSQYMLDEAFSSIVAIAPQYHMASTKVSNLRVVTLGSIVATDATVS